MAQYNLIIECKNISGNVWVFDSDTPSTFSPPIHSSVNKDKKPDPVFNVIPFDPISKIPSVSGYSEYVLDKKKSNEKTTNLFSAIMSTTKATNHMKTSMDKLYESYHLFKSKHTLILHFAFFQPVIVFTGKIYVSKFNDKNKAEFFREKFVQMEIGYESKEYHITSGSIHIVEYDHLGEYVEMVDQYYRQNENIMIKDKKIFLDCLKSAGFK